MTQHAKELDQSHVSGEHGGPGHGHQISGEGGDGHGPRIHLENINGQRIGNIYGEIGGSDCH